MNSGDGYGNRWRKQDSSADARVTRNIAATWRMRLKFANVNFGENSNLHV